MLVRDLLAHKNSGVVTLPELSEVGDAVSLMYENNVGTVVVVGEGREVRGIVSERDVVRALQERADQVRATPVEDVMTHDVMSCRPDDHLRSVMGIMNSYGFRHMPVVADGKLVGLVSAKDIFDRLIVGAEGSGSARVGATL